MQSAQEYAINLQSSQGTREPAELHHSFDGFYDNQRCYDFVFVGCVYFVVIAAYLFAFREIEKERSLYRSLVLGSV